MDEPVDENEAGATAAKALVVEAARQANYHDPTDALLFLDDSVMITDMASARLACDQLADAHPCLVIPEPQEPAGPPPPTPGTPGPHPKWRRHRPSADEQMLGMLQSGSRGHSGRRSR